MRKVTENIWLSDYEGLKEEAGAGALGIVGIRAILNVAYELNTPRYKDVALFKVGIVEAEGDNPIFEAVNLLDMLVTKYSVVLVHCYAAHNRSPLIVALWLYLKRGVPFDKAASMTGMKKVPWMDKWMRGL